jgi:hypothetical protein
MASVATASTSAASVLKDEMTSNKEQEGQKPAPAAVDVCDENKAESPRTRKRSSFCGLFSPFKKKRGKGGSDAVSLPASPLVEIPNAAERARA